MSPKIILLNGPPRCGKDTAQLAMPDSIRMKFAKPVKEGAHKAFGLMDADMDFFEDFKDKPLDEFFGATPRQVYISFSEDFMKKVTGDKKVFGKLLAKEIREFEDSVLEGGHTYMITDSGFRKEAEAIVEEFGAENVLLIRIYRGVLNFQGDSRSYIKLDDLGVKEKDIINMDIGDFKKTIKETVEEFTNG